jgi:hypothetical protein
VRIIQALIVGAVLMAGVAPTAMSQATASPTPGAEEATTLVGTAVSASKNTLVVRTRANTHEIFVFDGDTTKPEAISIGAEVTVTSVSTGEPGVRLARIVSLGGESAQRAQSGEQSASGPPPIPPTTKRVQSDIERHMRNIVIGARAGIGMDPEVIIVGVQSRMGPIFNRNIQFRPSAEFGFGEVSKFLDFNADVSYRLPLTPHWSSWSTYLAAGPAFGFSQQHFEKGSTGIDWGNLEFTPGLNVVAGLESRKGFLVEFRSTVYASPNPIFRLMFGYYF